MADGDEGLGGGVEGGVNVNSKSKISNNGNERRSLTPISIDKSSSAIYAGNVGPNIL